MVPPHPPPLIAGAQYPYNENRLRDGKPATVAGFTAILESDKVYLAGDGPYVSPWAFPAKITKTVTFVEGAASAPLENFHKFCADACDAEGADSCVAFTVDYVLGHCLLSDSLEAKYEASNVGTPKEWFVRDSAVADPAAVCPEGQFFGADWFSGVGYEPGIWATAEVGCLAYAPNDSVEGATCKFGITNQDNPLCKDGTAECRTSCQSSCKDTSDTITFDLLGLTDFGCEPGLGCIPVPERCVSCSPTVLLDHACVGLSDFHQAPCCELARKPAQ